MIQGVLEQKNPQEDLYADLLETMGDLKNNYGDYMITEPIDCNEELKRVSGADAHSDIFNARQPYDDGQPK